MITRLLSVSDSQTLPSALKILRQGGVIAFPTDTVYGLGCLVNFGHSIDRIYQIKERDLAKAIPVLIGAVDQLTQVAADPGNTASKLAAHFWPGALTLVVPRNPQLPANLSQLPTIGVRMPDHPFALALLRSAGPLATTSANLSGLTSPVTAQDVLAQLDGRVDLVIDGGSCPGGVPSTVVDCTGADPIILREGAVTRTMLAQALGGIF